MSLQVERHRGCPVRQGLPETHPRATPGKVLVAADLSQIELRLTAWTANERNMLNIYRSGGDIHEATAAAVARVDIVTFQSWKGNETPLIDVANDIPGAGSVLGALNPGKRREFTLNDYYKLQRFRARMQSTYLENERNQQFTWIRPSAYSSARGSVNGVTT